MTKFSFVAFPQPVCKVHNLTGYSKHYSLIVVSTYSDLKDIAMKSDQSNIVQYSHYIDYINNILLT